VGTDTDAWGAPLRAGQPFDTLLSLSVEHLELAALAQVSRDGTLLQSQHAENPIASLAAAIMHKVCLQHQRSPPCHCVAVALVRQCCSLLWQQVS